MPTAPASMIQPDLLFPISVGRPNPGDGYGCCGDGLETVHSQTSSLESAVILLDSIVQVSARSRLRVAPDESLGAQQPQYPSARDLHIERRFTGTAAVQKKGRCASDSAVWAHEEVNRPALLAARPVKAKPSAPELRVCLIDAPGAARGFSKRVPAVLEIGHETLHPAPDCL